MRKRILAGATFAAAVLLIVLTASTSKEAIAQGQGVTAGRRQQENQGMSHGEAFL